MHKMQVVKRQPKLVKIVGLKGDDAHDNEVLALSRLSNVECICQEKRRHFPNILDIKEEINQISMSLVGDSLNKNKKDLKEWIDEDGDYKEQCECIANALMKSCVYQVDQPLTGQNLCFDPETKTLNVIDFAISAFKYGNNGVVSKSASIKKWLRGYGVDEIYKKNYKLQLEKVIEAYLKRVSIQRS